MQETLTSNKLKQGTPLDITQVSLSLQAKSPHPTTTRKQNKLRAGSVERTFKYEMKK